MTESPVAEARRAEIEAQGAVLTPGERLLRALALSELCLALRAAGREAENGRGEGAS